MKSNIYILIAILLAVNNIFVNFKIGPISFDRLLEFGIFFIFFKSYVEELKNNTFFRKYNTYIIAFACLQLIMNIKLVAFNDMPMKIIYVSFIKCFSFIVFSYLFLLIAKENNKYINIVIGIHLLVCFFALLQHPASPFSAQAHELKMILYQNVSGDPNFKRKLANQGLYIELGIGSRFRISGPFASSITFSYFLISTLFLNIYMFFRTKKRVYLAIIGVILVCSFLTQTRSLILAEVVIFMGIFFFINNKLLTRYKVAISILVLAGSLLVVQKMGQSMESKESSRLTKFNDKGSDRELLWLTGIYAIANHPLGISDLQYEEIRKEMYYTYGSLSVLHMPCHNGFINTAFNYTIFGYFLMIGFFIFIYKRTKHLSKDYRVIFYTFYIAYIVHSSFHNNFLFYSDYDIYMVLMLITVHYSYEKNIKESPKPTII